MPKPMPRAEEKKMVGHRWTACDELPAGPSDAPYPHCCECGWTCDHRKPQGCETQHADHVAALASQVPAQPPAEPGKEWRAIIVGLPIIRELLNGEEVHIETFRVILMPDDVLFNARPNRES